jgi:alpha-amylase
MTHLLACAAAVVALLTLSVETTRAENPWNGKVVLQAFWWDAWNERYPQDWYTYLAKLAPRLRDLGFDGMWIPSPVKGNAGVNSMGYDVFDHYDLGEKDQKGTVATRFGTKDSLLRLVAVAHANGLEIYPDVVLNHMIGGELDPVAPGDRFKKFRYAGFASPTSGRWAKDHWNFHPNPDHLCTFGDWCQQLFGPDACFLDAAHGGGGNGRYMLDQARVWLRWLRKQTGADGFRFDAVKHYPAYVVEDLLFNTMGSGNEYFSVGEFVGGRDQLDGWAAETLNRSGTFDFALRDALASIVEAGGFFDIGALPRSQQANRVKTVPFINNHDTWRGLHWDSEPGSSSHDDRDGDWRQNRDELAPTIDPDHPRADVAYAAAMAVDGSPMIYYEDLFINNTADRFRLAPGAIPLRPYIANLIWAHQKLEFKAGAYKVRHQGSADLLVIERSGRALIGLNDHGTDTKTVSVQTDFGTRRRLHDYSGANSGDVETDDGGRVTVSVPPMSYAVWGPAGEGGGFDPPPRRTIQEFQLDDDLGDARASTPQYGGRLRSGEVRTAGAIWSAAGKMVKVSVFSDDAVKVELTMHEPDAEGEKSRSAGQMTATGSADRDVPLVLEVVAEKEGYHQLSVRLVSGEATRAYVKVEYEAPRESSKF